MLKFKDYIVMIIIGYTQVVYSADLMDIYDRSLKYNNDLIIINNNHKISKEIYNQTSSSIFPEVSIIANTQQIKTSRYTGTGTISDYSNDNATLKITQPILRLYFFDELNKAESNLDKSKITVDNHKSDLIIQSAQLYFSLIKSKNKLLEANTNKSMMLLKYNNAKKLFLNGYITDLELNRYKNLLDVSEVETQISNNKLDMVKQDIYILTGKDIQDIHNLNPMIDITLSNYDANNLIKSALVSFETIKLALVDISISKDEMRSNRSKHYPTIDLVATYDYSDTGNGSRFGRQTRESNTVGLTLNIPIYQGGYQSAKVAEAKHRYENSKINLDQLRREIKKDIIDNINNHNLLKNYMIVNKNKYINSNEDYISMQTGFESGAYSDVEVKESEYNLIVSKNELISSMLDYLLVDLKLKKYSSKLTVDNIKVINKMLNW